MKGRQGVQVPLPAHLVGQLPGDGGVDAKKSVQRIAVLHLGEAANHEEPGILSTQVFDLVDPIQKRLTFGVGRLLFGVGRRHVVSLHVGGRLLPPFGDGRIARMAERRLKIDPSLLLVLPMAADAVGLDEGSDTLLEGLLGVGLKRGKIPTNGRLCHGRPHEKRHDPAQSPGQLKTSWKFRDCHGERCQA